MSYLKLTAIILSAISVLLIVWAAPSHCKNAHLSSKETCNPTDYIGDEVIVTLSAIPVPSPHGNWIDTSNCPRNVHISFELTDEARSSVGNEFERAIKFDPKSEAITVEFTARAFVEDYTKAIKDAPHLIYRTGDIYYSYTIIEVISFRLYKKK